MADTKITALAAITTVDPAADVLPIVDISDTSMAASGTTKKITSNQILGAGGTATLASATISGALTVDTSTLVVDPANDRVGIGTASPGSRLDVRFSTNPVIDNAVPTNALRVFTSVAQAVDVGGQIGLGGLYDATNFQAFANISGKKENSTSGNNAGYLVIGTCNSSGTMAERYRIDSSGISTWSVTGTPAMTLNSTGLGIGVTPSYKFHVKDGGSDMYFRDNGITSELFLNCEAGGNASLYFGDTADAARGGIVYSVADDSLQLRGYNNTERMRIDSSGNVGIGVTPSAWNSDFRALQVSSSGSYLTSYISGATVNQWLFIGNNAFYDTVDSRWEYIRSKPSAQYIQYNNEHQWLRDTGTQTAGAACTFTQAMTLDASGNLLVGTTSNLIASSRRLSVVGTVAAALQSTGAATVEAVNVWHTATTGNNIFIDFDTEASVTSRGSISYNRAGGLVAYNTTSDYRAKDIIGPVSNSGSLIDSLKVYVGKMKDATIERPMLIAHEAQEVAPYAVTGLKDEVDADGNPKYQQMDVSSLVPLLIAEIQSLRARVQTLEAR
jgi:hypothetical protein